MKKTKKIVKSMIPLGIGIGVGASLTSGSASGGIAKIGGAMPALGSIAAAGMTMGALKGLQKSAELPKKKKK